MKAHRYAGFYRHYLQALALAALSLTSAGADVVEQGPKDSAPSGLLAGVARADITVRVIGQAIKRASPFKYTMCAGYSSGEGGDYMPTDTEYAFGGYEVERTPYGQGVADKLIRETIAMFEDVK